VSRQRQPKFVPGKERFKLLEPPEKTTPEYTVPQITSLVAGENPELSGMEGLMEPPVMTPPIVLAAATGT
jgi:hypothetical protein